MMVVQMHLACKRKGEEEEKVVKTFRDCGYFAYERGEDGEVQVARGGRWESLPSCGLNSQS